MCTQRQQRCVARYTAKQTEEQKQQTKQKKAAQQRTAYVSQIVENCEYRRLQKANNRVKQSDEEWAAAKAKDYA